MFRQHLPLRVPLLFCALLALATCESSEERAERHYQSALAFLETGDIDRALVELRNVIKFDNDHGEGRLTYARVLAEQGDAEQSISQYLRVAEQHPDLLEARVAVTRMALQQNAWEQAERHGRAAREIEPNEPVVVFLNAMLDYHAALLAGDELQMSDAMTIVRRRVASDPGDRLAWRMIVDNAIIQGDTSNALNEIRKAMIHLPDDFDLHLAKLQLQMEQRDMAVIGTTLQVMVAKFPEDLQAHNMLLAWYLEQEDKEGAEAFLRLQAAAPGAKTDKHLRVVEFLRTTQGNNAARVELKRLIDENPDETAYKATWAALDFEAGNTEAAIATMQSLLSDTEQITEETANLQVSLARMLFSNGDIAGAKNRVADVLEGTPGHVEALKMHAAWQIQDDQPETAILTLRTAQAEAPRDPGIMTLMGQAHERAGARELAGERYALAVDASGRAPGESLRYAAFLLQDNRVETAESVLNDALRVLPSNIQLLSAMADLQIRKQDWTRVLRIIWQLRSLDTPIATTAANRIEVTYLTRQNRFKEVVSLLESLAESNNQDTTALAKLIQALVQQGRTDEAQILISERLADMPNNPELRFLRAGLHLAEDALDQAEAIYRALIEDFPEGTQPLRQLVMLLRSQNRGTEADALIDSVIASQPELEFPRQLKAEQLERDRNFEGAIALYEALYAKNSSNLAVANNLASLLSTHRQDDESLSRAYTIARRLRNADIPAFQDTYGWIAFRRGNHFEALTHLEPAARGLPDDPLVQYHLGETYMALGRVQDAKNTLELALNLAGDSDLPQFERAREMLKSNSVAD